MAAFERNLRQDVATDYSALCASPLASARDRPEGRLATVTSPMMGVREASRYERPGQTKNIRRAENC
jgi:hypothetical protein